MSWIRFDDKTARHPKIGQLTDPQFRTWFRLLCYCAEYRTEGTIPPAAEVEVPGYAKHRTRLAELGLVDTDGPEWQVHDWDIYNGDTETRVYSYLEDHPDATANEVFRSLGGRRGHVLELVAQYRDRAGTNGTEKPVPRVPATGTGKRY